MHAVACMLLELCMVQSFAGVRLHSKQKLYMLACCRIDVPQVHYMSIEGTLMQLSLVHACCSCAVQL